jgi:hypothetical protein
MAKLPLICVDDYEKYAKEKLGQYAGLIVNGADDSITANDNKRAYKRYCTVQICFSVYFKNPEINNSGTFTVENYNYNKCISLKLL